MEDEEFSLLLRLIEELSDSQMKLLETVAKLDERIEWLEKAVEALAANQRLDQ